MEKRKIVVMVTSSVEVCFFCLKGYLCKLLTLVMNDLND